MLQFGKSKISKSLRPTKPPGKHDRLETCRTGFYLGANLAREVPPVDGDRDAE